MAKNKTVSIVLKIHLLGGVVMTTDPLASYAEAERVEDCYRQNLGKLVERIERIGADDD